METLTCYVIRFSKFDAEQWAVFSGDYNPIHFDLNEARKLGMGKLIIHGMLAAMPVKSNISKQTPVQNEGGWLRFKTLFCKPIPQDSPMIVETLGRNGKLCFSVKDPITQTEYFKGHFGKCFNQYLPVGDKSVFLTNEKI